MRSWPYVTAAAILGIAGTLCLSMGGTNAAPKTGAPSAKAAEPAYAPRKKGTLTFNRDIASIIHRNCASCHRPGEVAPFSLLTYQDVKKRAQQIALVTENRFMPPWKAEHGYGDFADERRLTNEEKGLLKQWAAEGAKEGRAADLPATPKFTNGWTLGKPDAVFEMPEDYALGAEGADVYRNFVIPTTYAENRYIAAVDVRPGNRAVVHHVIAYLDVNGKARELDAKDPGPGYTSFGGVGFLPSGALGGWAPGNLPHRMPAGVGTLLPKSADIVLQVHYHKSGKAEKDRTKIGVYFCKEPVDKRVRYLPVIYPWLNIKPGDANYTVQAAMPVAGDVTALSVTPHMHLLGKEVTVKATLPDKSDLPMVRIPDWDFNWQTTYTFKYPLRLPKGSRVNMTARYDNSEKNPRNPSRPPRTVHWGEQTTDEMCVAFVAYTVDYEHLTRGIEAKGFFDFGNAGQRRNPSSGRRLLRQFLDQKQTP